MFSVLKCISAEGYPGTFVRYDLRWLICDLRQSGQGGFSLFQWLCTGGFLWPTRPALLADVTPFPFLLQATACPSIQTGDRPDQRAGTLQSTTCHRSRLSCEQFTVQEVDTNQVGESQGNAVSASLGILWTVLIITAQGGAGKDAKEVSRNGAHLLSKTWKERFIPRKATAFGRSWFGGRKNN